MKWKPADVIRLIALVAAVMLFALGSWMMVQGVAARGTIDIESSLVSGSLKTGSAGLFIAFLSFVIIIVVLTSSSLKGYPNVSRLNGRSRFARLLPIFWGLLLAVIGSVFAAKFLSPIFGPLTGGLGVLLLIVIEQMLALLKNE